MIFNEKLISFHALWLTLDFPVKKNLILKLIIKFLPVIKVEKQRVLLIYLADH